MAPDDTQIGEGVQYHSIQKGEDPLNAAFYLQSNLLSFILVSLVETVLEIYRYGLVQRMRIELESKCLNNISFNANKILEGVFIMSGFF